MPRQPADVALGLTRRSSNESLAKSFVIAAANLTISDPHAQLMMPAQHSLGPQQAALRHHGPPYFTLSSRQYLIPGIRPQDIENLTLNDEPMVLELTDSVSAHAPELALTLPVSSGASSTILAPASEHRCQPLEAAGPYFPTCHRSDTSQAVSGARRDPPEVQHGRRVSDHLP